MYRQLLPPITILLLLLFSIPFLAEASYGPPHRPPQASSNAGFGYLADGQNDRGGFYRQDYARRIAPRIGPLSQQEAQVQMASAGNCFPPNQCPASGLTPVGMAEFNPSSSSVGRAPTINLHNWAGNIRYSTQNIQYPRTVAEVQQIVRGARQVRCLGQRHSFNRGPDTADTIIGTIGLRNIMNPYLPGVLVGIDPRRPTVTVQGGITYTDLTPFIHDTGFALANLAELAEISVAGATQNAAHGSGNTLGCLSTQIVSMQLVLANGSIANIPAGDPRLKAFAVGLGAFGVVTAVELALEPTYNVKNNVFLNLTNADLLDQFDAIMGAGYSVKVVADFTMPFVWNQVFVIERMDQQSGIGNQQVLPGTSARRATKQVAPSAVLPKGYLSAQGVEQPWHYGLPDYQLGLSGFDDYRNNMTGIGSGPDEIQAEYFVPYANARAVIRELTAAWQQIAPALWYAAIRTVAADDLWMSMAYDERGEGIFLSIDFTFKPSIDAINAVLSRLVEPVLLKYGARPHWGKYFLMEPGQFLHQYPRLNDFRALAEQFDPGHKFRNPFVDHYVFGAN